MTTREIAEELFQTLETGLADPCTREEIYLLRDHTCEVITRAVEDQEMTTLFVILDDTITDEETKAWAKSRYEHLKERKEHQADLTRAVEAEREVLRRIHNEADDAHYWNGSGKEARLCQAVANISEWSEEAIREGEKS